MKFAVIFLTMTSLVLSQRPPYAGSRKPYPEVQPWFTTPTTSTEALGDRFNQPTTTTERLPIDAYGDRELFNQIATWPREKWPFWYLNWQILEQARNRSQPIQPNNSNNVVGNRFSQQDNAPAFAPSNVAFRPSFVRP